MSEFTKGKWKAMSDGTIAVLNRRGEPGDIVASADSIERDVNEVLANTRLIAAAPAMYELLQAILHDGIVDHEITARTLLAEIDDEDFD